MKRLSVAVLIAVLIFVLLSCSFMEGTDAEKVASSCMPAILELSISFQASQSYATGFIISSDGYVLTNAHVVTREGSFFEEAITITGNFYNSSTEYLMEIVDYDTDIDVAVIRFVNNTLALPCLQTADSDSLSYGGDAYVIGNSENYGLSITKGIISAPKRLFKDSKTAITSEVIQTDAPINSGSSGAPLLNPQGKVVGMITFKPANTVSEGIGFAVPSKIFMEFYETAVKKKA